jgi:hypothetical protein
MRKGSGKTTRYVDINNIFHEYKYVYESELQTACDRNRIIVERLENDLRNIDHIRASGTHLTISEKWQYRHAIGLRTPSRCT